MVLSNNKITRKIGHSLGFIFKLIVLWTTWRGQTLSDTSCPCGIISVVYVPPLVVSGEIGSSLYQKINVVVGVIVRKSKIIHYE